jgi:hypothetical protein
MLSLNSPCIFIIPEIHQQMHKSLKKVQSALYYSRTLHMFRLSMSHHQGLSNSASQMLDRPIIDIRKIFCALFIKTYISKILSIKYS